MPLPQSAQVVVIGAGIVGNSLVQHLARLGWRDIVQIDKGPLPNPGGSTGHASNFIFPVDHSREITDLTLDSVRQYQELDVFTQCGGIEIARTEERMEELRRRMSSAKAWGIEAELITPEQVQERVPFIDISEIIGAFWTPSVGVVDSLRAGTLMREEAMAAGALTVVPNVEVTGMDVVDGALRGVRTDQGDIACDTVVIACGVWSPHLAAMAGASIPLTPAVHQMISVGPIPQLAALEGEISFPIVRDMDSLCYERQHGADMEVGSYAHRAILHDPEEIPSIDRAKLSPTEMPFTADDFDPQLETALELMPDALGADGAEIRYAINGLLSLTPDGAPILGESPEVRGLWSAAAVWIKEGPGRRARGRGVDDPRLLRDRPAPQRHRPLPPPPAHPRARAGAHVGGVHQDLRDRAPRGAVELRAPQAAVADVRRPGRAGRRVLRDRRLGAPAVVRLQRVPPRGVRRRRHAARQRVGQPVVEPDHQRRAPRDAGAGRHRRPVGVLHLRRLRTRRAGRGAADRRGAGRRRAGAGRLHPGARRQGRVPLRPDGDAAGPRPLPGRHRWRARDGRPGLVPRPRPGPRRRGDRPDVGVHHDRAVGPARPRRAGPRHGGRHQPRGVQVRHRAPHRGRQPGRAGLADLLRRRPGLGALRADGAGRPAVVAAARGGRARRRGAGRHRRLRHDGASREGLPGLRRRARHRAHHRRGRDAAAAGEGGGLHRARRLPRPAGEGPGPGDVHAGRRRPHVGVGGEALHARRRADPDRFR